MNASRSPRGQGRRTRNTFTTKSGKTIKVHHSLGDRLKASKLAKATSKATYLSTLPKSRLKRVLYRLHPQRLAQYWFSREGGIMALKIVGISIIAGFFLIIGMFAYFRKDLPKLKDVSSATFGGSITYYDRTGKTVLWQDYDAVKRVPVEGNQMSKYMREATVAIEDKDFYKHGAFDVRGIMRAGIHDAIGGSGSVQGGSSITQQLVKLNQNWTDNRTITRKVKELILAVELEREYTKDDILTGYLNIAPYGGVDYGIETAARDYFHTDAKDLTLAQSALLAAMPQAPGYYSPYASPKYNSSATVDNFGSSAVIARQHYILDKMVQQGYITKVQAADAKKIDILATIQPQTPKYQGIKAPYFVLAAKQELTQRFGSNIVARGGWSVITTLNLDLQNKAEELVASNLPNVTRVGGDEEATVAEDVQTGQIVSLVGGTDFTNAEHGQNNFAAGIKLPPGSSFKPYDYVTLINNNNNVGAGSVLYDAKNALPGYEGTCSIVPSYTSPDCPGGTAPYLYDYDRRFPGPETLRYALGNSRNIPAAKAMISSLPNDTSKGRVNSINKVLATASAMMDNTYDQSKHRNSYGCYSDEALTQTTQCYLASAIGDGAFLHLDDHVNGLATLARLGQAIPHTYILKVTDSSDRNVYQWKQPQSKQAVQADAAYIVDDMASDYKASYLSGSCTDTNCNSSVHGGKFHRYNGWQFAIKTGTTNDNYDGLMTSWSTKYSIVTWVGHHTRHVALNTNAMESLTEPITRGWMEYAHKGLPPSNWKQPTTVKSSPAFVMRTPIYSTNTVPSPTNDLYPGWYVGGNKNAKSTSQTNDKVSGKVATSCTPAAAKDTVTNGNVSFWNVDIFNGGKTSISDGNTTSATGTIQTDDVHNCNDTPPVVSITIRDSASGQVGQCNPECSVVAVVTAGTHPLNDPQYPQFPGTISFTLNGQTINTQTLGDSPSQVSFTYAPTDSGNITATALDSVLYSGSDSANFTYTPPTPVQAITITSPPSGGTVTNNGPIGVGWTAAVTNTTFKVRLKKNSGPYTDACTATNATTCNITLSGVGNYSIQVVDSDGNTSTNTVTITRI
jgi:membrane peptidoglycan carboxypeptidase